MIWWLFPNESHNTDGNFRQYLRRPAEWEQYDRELFGRLTRIAGEQMFGVSALESCGALDGAIFIREQVPCSSSPFSARPASRQNWLNVAKKKLESCDLIFLDPDNGLATSNLKLTRKCAGKSVTIDEIQSL